MKKKKKIQINFVKKIEKKINLIDKDSLRLYCEIMKGRWHGKV